MCVLLWQWHRPFFENNTCEPGVKLTRYPRQSPRAAKCWRGGTNQEAEIEYFYDCISQQWEARRPLPKLHILIVESQGTRLAVDKGQREISAPRTAKTFGPFLGWTFIDGDLNSPTSEPGFQHLQIIVWLSCSLFQAAWTNRDFHVCSIYWHCHIFVFYAVYS